MSIHDGPGCGSIHHFPDTPAQSELQSENCEYFDIVNIHNFCSEVRFAQACRGNDKANAPTARAIVYCQHHSTHLAGVEVPDVRPAPAAARVPELREKLVPVLVEITLALGEIFIDERVGAVLVTDVEDGLLVVLQKVASEGS